MKKAIRDYAKPFAAILGLAIIALGVGAYILSEQRLRFPFIQESRMKMNAEFIDASSVTPGQGQTVQVSGVKIGDITKVKLKDGRAVVGFEIDPGYEDLIHTDAKATLRPRTGLKDMYIQLNPGQEGQPKAKEGFTIPVGRTLTDVDLDEILANLDVDTRDYLRLFINGAGKGLHGRGKDLADVFRRFGPTFRDLGRVNKAVASEGAALKTTINSLARLNKELAGRDDDLAQLVDTSAATFRAFASEDDNLSTTVRLLPDTLKTASTTLQAVRPFAEQLGPASRALLPAFRALDRANALTRPFAREATPIIREKIRPFVRESRPVVRDLAPAAAGLSATAPDLTRAGKVLNTLFNLLGYNDNGREAPGVPNRDEGFLFWTAWASHQGLNLLSTEDANGPMRPVFLTGTCSTLTGLVNSQPGLEFGMALSPLLANVCGNPQTTSILPTLPVTVPTLPIAKKK